MRKETGIAVPLLDSNSLISVILLMRKSCPLVSSYEVPEFLEEPIIPFVCKTILHIRTESLNSRNLITFKIKWGKRKKVGKDV
jgi:hypothetical protein